MDGGGCGRIERVGGEGVTAGLVRGSGAEGNVLKLAVGEPKPVNPPNLGLLGDCQK